MSRNRNVRIGMIMTSAVMTTTIANADARADNPPGETVTTPTEARDVHDRRVKGLALTVGGQGGMTYYAEGTPFGAAKGIGRALAAGPNVGIRGSLEIKPWFAIDARGIFTNNEGNDYVGLGSLTTVGGFGAARFTAPFTYVRPYAFIGAGAFSVMAAGTSTQLTGGTYSAYVGGVGALVPVNRVIDVGAEFSYVHLNGETLSTNENADGGDPVNLSLVAQYRFEL